MCSVTAHNIFMLEQRSAAHGCLMVTGDIFYQIAHKGFTRLSVTCIIGQYVFSSQSNVRIKHSNDYWPVPYAPVDQGGQIPLDAASPLW